ncbi:unnamed protein product, partial [Rotaria magnacalcarata]
MNVGIPSVRPQGPYAHNAGLPEYCTTSPQQSDTKNLSGSGNEAALTGYHIEQRN